MVDEREKNNFFVPRQARPYVEITGHGWPLTGRVAHFLLSFAAVAAWVIFMVTMALILGGRHGS